MIDSHCHFDFAPFADDPERYLNAASLAGVEKLIIPAVGLDNWLHVSSLCQMFPHRCYYSLGIHPLWAEKHTSDELHQLEALLANRDDHCIAIGESGLDFALPQANKQHQITLLHQQLVLADKFGLPIILHCRKAHNELLTLLNQHPKARGVLHAFSGSEQQGKEYIRRGFYLGIGGTITYERAHKTRQAVAKLPLSALLLETDAPDMPIAGLQGKPNLPEYIPLIAKELAELKNTTVAEIAKQSAINTQKLFRLSLD